MVERISQVFRPHPVPARVESPDQVVSWVALQFRDLANYVTALEERIRPAVLWASLVDVSIGASIPFEVWPLDVVRRDDVGAGDYLVSLSALCLGTGGQTEVQFGASVDLTSPIIESIIIPLKNGEELVLALDFIVPRASTLVLWIRGENVDVTGGSVLAVRIGS